MGSFRRFLRWQRYPLHIHIAWLFILLILAYALVNNWYNDRQSRRMLLSSSQTLFNQIGARTGDTVSGLYASTGLAVDLLAREKLARARTLDERLQSLPYLIQILRDQAAVTAAYAGYANGDFFLLRRIPDEPTLRTPLHPPVGATLLVQSFVTGKGKSQGKYLYFDDQLKLIETRVRDDYHYDPRTRDWYKRAIAGSGRVVTQPYVFFTTHEIGTTFSRRSLDRNAVVGMDVTLAALSSMLAAQHVTTHSEMALLDPDGQVLAWHDTTRVVRPDQRGGFRLARVRDLGIPALTTMMAHPDTYKGNTAPIELGGATWYGYLAPLVLPQGDTLYLAVAAPDEELLADAHQLRKETALISLLLLLITVPVAMWVSLIASRPLKALIAQARDIQAMRFDSPVVVNSVVREIHELADAMRRMKQTIAQFRDIGDALADEREFSPLIQRILNEALHMAEARAAIIYLTETDGHLTAEQACRSDQEPVNPAALPVLIPEHEVQHPAVMADATGQTQSVWLEPSELNAWFGGVRHFEHAAVVVAIPLINRQEETVGVLTLFIEAAEALRGGHPMLAMLEAVSGTAAVAIETQRLIKEQQALLESFIQLVAGAIDAKSPYTGGHCQRVPELTKMLARAACETDEGPYRHYSLTTEEWEALHIGAWLHDCGKVTTPEYVVDKATKLETIYDRIHEIRMRFEVLKRDAWIGYWQGVAEGGDAHELAAVREQLLHELDDEYRFVARSNEGGEAMAQADIERLYDIGRRTWQRTLDDRIGISYEEQQRKGRTPAPMLPVAMPLLADLPEHVIYRNPRDQLPQGFGFDMKVPEYLYNRGELHNLSVKRGTLTEEERYKINEHIVQTIVMLEKLPFPRHLRNVPEIAGGHHEKMDGTGYPRRLKREQMSPLARMMAIADIFEALTAVDRPYKRGKTLTEAINIMARMRREQHIDPELFELFLRSGVYLQYSERYLQPDQIDSVNVEAALA
ncbi:HD domain-containing phosphohydrolase [Silvimonas iriomotensis]|uniref:Phosphodiesterase n=1 Tax=Silvimonas iriomotensis TaxID=449662 RepID=A0ABQ2P949_9NEIS|nr:HD domain-containing phosphohydrolase [Silvimonas iriomotensis]GGP21421.1 phosphodiesterase [Silvimonas iriomotensis]